MASAQSVLKSISVPVNYLLDGSADRSGIVEKMLDCGNDSVDIIPFLKEAQWLAVG